MKQVKMTIELLLEVNDGWGRHDAQKLLDTLSLARPIWNSGVVYEDSRVTYKEVKTMFLEGEEIELNHDG